MRKKLIISLLIALVITSTAALIICNQVIADSASGKLYSEVDQLPYMPTGLLLGTNKYLGNHAINLFYKYRIDAAVALIKSGKIKYIIVSGDNSRKDYDESTQMKNDLIAEGVDSSKIFLDYAGFRTYDSMVRAHEVFGQDSLTVISQQFHNERALYIAKEQGITAIAFNANDVPAKVGLRTNVRERFARVKVFIDECTCKKPKFLGPHVKVG